MSILSALICLVLAPIALAVGQVLAVGIAIVLIALMMAVLDL